MEEAESFHHSGLVRRGNALIVAKLNAIHQVMTQSRDVKKIINVDARRIIA